MYGENRGYPICLPCFDTEQERIEALGGITATGTGALEMYCNTGDRVSMMANMWLAVDSFTVSTRVPFF